MINDQPPQQPADLAPQVLPPVVEARTAEVHADISEKVSYGFIGLAIGATALANVAARIHEKVLVAPSIGTAIGSTLVGAAIFFWPAKRG